jgi:DNA polymerase V
MHPIPQSSSKNLLQHQVADAVVIDVESHTGSVKFPIFINKVSAGFASPADDYIEKALDLNELLVQKPAATFFVRVQGDSMIGVGIHPNDVLVVDRSIEPIDGKVVIASINGELTVKTLVKNPDDTWKLQAENRDYPDIALTDELDLVIWGVVTSVVHRL